MGNSSTSFIESKLGNPFFASDSSNDSQLSKLLGEFTLVSTYEDELFERCSVLEHKTSKELIITKEVNCAHQPEMNALFEEFQRRKALLKHINLLRLRYVLKKRSDGLFSDQFKIILFFDYVVTSLHAEYFNRQKTKLPFSADEINIIISGALRAYSSLEAESIPNSKVRLSNIYFGLQNGETIPKIIDAKLFPNSTNMASVAKEEDCLDVFLSPQELRNMSNQQYYNPKSGVFSLGVSLMQLCLLTPSRELYNYSKGYLNFNELETRLNIVKNKYPLSVFYLIREMLERNEDGRASFLKLANSLPENVRNLPPTMMLSVMKGANLASQSRTKLLPPTGYTKLINPTPISRNDRKMHSTTLASEYRPNVEASELYTNGNMYTGQKKDNLRHGKGKYVYADGSYYFGDWLKGKMEGFGQLYDTEGNLQYEGEWKDDHYDGKGKLMPSGQDWGKYEGEFRSGKMDGFGEMMFRNGDRYKGEFRADYPWGKGRLFRKGGQMQAGIWEKGNFISQF